MSFYLWSRWNIRRRAKQDSNFSFAPKFSCNYKKAKRKAINASVEKLESVGSIETRKSERKARIFLFGRGDKIRTCDFYVPNVALYQAEPHLDIEFLI